MIYLGRVGGDYLRSLNPRLPLPVWLLQVGGLTNSFGNGLVLPFLVIYLHNIRGFSLGTAGLIVAVSSFAQLVAGVMAGPLIDRVGARPTLAAGLVLQAVGFGLLPLVREPWRRSSSSRSRAPGAPASGRASRR